MEKKKSILEELGELIPLLDTSVAPRRTPRIMENKFLPVPESVPASDLETRRLILVPTGRDIHGMVDRTENVIYLSTQRLRELQDHFRSTIEKSE